MDGIAMDVVLSAELQRFLVFVAVFAVFLLFLRCMFWLVAWGKKRPKGGYLLIALMPLMSIFPIPAQEVKKIEAIKKEHVQAKEENGEPKDKSVGDHES